MPLAVGGGGSPIMAVSTFPERGHASRTSGTAHRGNKFALREAHSPVLL